MSLISTPTINDGSAKDANDVTQILTERGHRYGKFVEQAEISQDLKSVIDIHLNRRLKSMSPDQHEALEMICHKIARIINGDENYLDHWIDISGYAKLVADRLQGIER